MLGAAREEKTENKFMEKGLLGENAPFFYCIRVWGKQVFLSLLVSVLSLSPILVGKIYQQAGENDQQTSKQNLNVNRIDSKHDYCI